MTEIWKQINNYPNYEISSEGNIRRKKSKRPLKPQKLGDGYKAVFISSDVGEKQKWEYIHRLVALHFIPNPNNYKIVAHKASRDDNRVENLEWRKGSIVSEGRQVTSHRYYESHKEEILARKKAYYEAHKEEILKRCHEYYIRKTKDK